jgi:hypothetical protein
MLTTKWRDSRAAHPDRPDKRGDVETLDAALMLSTCVDSPRFQIDYRKRMS